jgi:hypothetical protein
VAILTLDDARIWHAEYNLSGLSNRVEHPISFDVNDVTTFTSSGWRERKAGLAGGQVSVTGFYDAEAADAGLFADIGSNVALSVAAGSAVGDTAYVGTALEGGYQPGAAVGDVFGFTGDWMTSDKLARGELLSASTETAGGNSAGNQLGALSATQTLVVNLHVVAISGGTLTVTIESDDNAGFTTATTRATFTAATAATSEQQTVAGAVTDDYWRAVWTLPTGTATFAVAAGIR